MSFLRRFGLGQKKQPNEQNVEVATPEEVKVESGEIKRIVLPDTLTKFMRTDYDHRSPSEFAFLASGVVTQEGVGIATYYYGGELDETSPVHCTLKESFISRVLYDEIPRTHNLIIWGHFHPISGPSSTDSRSLRQLELFFSKIGKRKPIAMLFDTTDMNVTCYSTSGVPIPHELLEIRQVNTKQPAKPITCPNCGSRLSFNARFCDKCGHQQRPEDSGVP